jgi:hypothetical protein
MEQRDQGLARELTDLALGDARLNARAVRIALRMEKRPADSFPDQMANDAELEATYRFFANDSVTLPALLQPHVSNTHQRMESRALVRVLHDTTGFRFEGDRDGLGPLGRGAAGFYAHVALAVDADELREPLGVLGVHTYVQEKEPPNRGLTPSEKVARTRATPRAEKISSRWEGLALATSKDAPPGVLLLHVMDQEADDYAALAALIAEGLHFVVRGSCDRKLKFGGATAGEVLAVKTAEIFRDVEVNPRSEKKAVANRKPPRAGRIAKLSIRYGALVIERGNAQSEHQMLPLNAVHVFETDTPDGEEPIEWMLFTSEPVTTRADAEAIVDHYRARWVIEEYFKAVKTGCAFEKRQLTTYESLLRALGLTLPLAWRLLVLRNLGRTNEPIPASTVFDGEQLQLLRRLAERRRRPMPYEPTTVRDAMLALAAIGGHLKSNGDPGWQVLGRGHRRFLEAEEGWRLARGCDQS